MRRRSEKGGIYKGSAGCVPEGSSPFLPEKMLVLYHIPPQAGQDIERTPQPSRHAGAPTPLNYRPGKDLPQQALSVHTLSGNSTSGHVP